jgi:16S rRNA (guanine966-N2)-methyltransferase
VAVSTGTPVRPTPDRVRETVFNWLSPVVAGSRCLDLYAGTGVLGLEALSRGAREARFVEGDRALAEALEAQIEALAAEATVICGRVEDVLARAPQERFDIVFLDPPYETPLESILRQLPDWLAPKAYVYVERPAGAAETDPLERAAEGLPGATVMKRSRAGRVVYGLLLVDK